ncbi:MAG: serine/threonine protein kinase [Myxococcales bacterium]|nr:serine/threonine protein kinase [Myxococcales bacterium]
MTARVPPELRASDDWIGQIIGNYRLVRLLGEGGMGMVFEAYNEAAGGRAAVKILRPEVSMRPEVAGRFFNEARAANAIQHPGIVRIFDCGHTVERAAFLTMEFLEGKSLRSLLDGIGQLGSADVVRLGRQMASALSAAHRKNIVHRDLKPDNLMLVADPDIPGGERVKILDFGIAKLAEGLSGAASVTDSNLVMGTPAYMAPEQCKGAKLVTDRSDVYSLGVIFYQMLAGRPPFIADAAGALLIMQVTETVPPLAQFAPDAHPALSNLIAAMLAKEPTVRPAMETVQAELQRIESSLLYGTDAAAGSGPSHVPTLPLTKPPRELLLEMARAMAEEPGPAQAEADPSKLHSSTVTGAASEAKRRTVPQRKRLMVLAAGIGAVTLAGIAVIGWRMRPVPVSVPSERPASIRGALERSASDDSSSSSARNAATHEVTKPAESPGRATTAEESPPKNKPSTAPSAYQIAQKYFRAHQYAEAVKAAEKCNRQQLPCVALQAKAACHTHDRTMVKDIVEHINSGGSPKANIIVNEINSECIQDNLTSAESLIEAKSYAKAQSLAVSGRILFPERAWLIIGQSACGLHDKPGARQALSHLDTSNARADKLKTFCQGLGVSLQ